MSQDNAPELHSSIVALTTLAAGVAAGHPTQPRCQLDRLRGMGIPESQIHTVVELARHMRDEAARQGDEELDDALVGPALAPGASAGCCGSEPAPAKTGSSCC